MTVGSIDEPAPGSAVGASALRVRGWAHGFATPVSRVDVYLGDRWLGRAGLGRPRPDVAAGLADPDALLCGFELLAVGPPPGPACVRAVVTHLDGSSHELGEVAVDVHPRPQPAPAPPPGPVAAASTTGGPIRVLWSARSLDHGGSQLRMAELIRHLSETHRFHQTVISPVDGPLRDALEQVGAAVHVMAPVPLDDLAAYDRGVARLRTWMDGGRFDLIVGFSATSFPAVDAAVRSGLPSVLRIGEAEPLRTVVDWLLGRFDPAVEERARQAVAAASAVISNSHAAVATYQADGYTGRFTVIPTGVDRVPRHPSDQDTWRARLGIDRRERLLVCPGTVWPVKGHGTLALALKHVRYVRHQMTCAVIGEAGSEFAAALQTQPDLRLVPFQEDLGPWWSAADAVVCASESEALPAAVLEGMAHGLPVLSSRVGDLPRFVDEGVNGWLFDHSDVGSLMVALHSVATASSSDLRRMGKDAAQTVAEQFDRTTLLQRTADLLAGVATGQLAPT